MKKYFKGKDVICTNQSRYVWNDDSHTTIAKILVDNKNELSLLFEVYHEKTGLGAGMTKDYKLVEHVGTIQKPKTSMIHNQCLQMSYNDHKMKRDRWVSFSGNNTGTLADNIDGFTQAKKFDLL